MSVVKGMDNIYATRILSLLLLPFDKQKAFKFGLIDDNGNHLKEPRTSEEMENYDALHRVLFKVKQLILRLPAGDTRLKQLALALQLIRQRIIPKQYQVGLSESVAEEYLKRYIFLTSNNISLVEEEIMVKNIVDLISEEGEAAAPTNVVAGIEPVGAPVINPKKKKPETISRQEIKEELETHNTLYVSRDVLNNDEISAWAKSVGFDAVVDDMHVTIAYSKAKVSDVSPDTNQLELHISTSFELFGENKDVVVLKFDDATLKTRWQYFIDHGASWDWDGYHPHITLTYKGELPEGVDAYKGKLVLGPEKFEELDENWKDKVKES